jgi:putative transposase
MDDLAGLPEEARRLAMERFRLLQPQLEQNESLISVAKAAGIPYRTAHRLVSAYRRHGLAALVRKKRTDRGQRRAVSDSLKKASKGWHCRSLLCP